MKAPNKQAVRARQEEYRTAGNQLAIRVFDIYLLQPNIASNGLGQVAVDLDIDWHKNAVLDCAKEEFDRILRQLDFHDKDKATQYFEEATTLILS